MHTGEPVRVLSVETATEAGTVDFMLLIGNCQISCWTFNGHSATFL
jgi:hypothetical protein